MNYNNYTTVSKADEDDEDGAPPGIPSMLLRAALPYQTYEMVRHQRITSFYRRL